MADESRAPRQLSLFQIPEASDPRPEPPAEPTPPPPIPPSTAPASVEPRTGADKLTPIEARRALQARLEAALGKPLACLTLTRNRSRIVSAKPAQLADGGEGLAMRVHRCFVDADDATVAAVADFFTLEPGSDRQLALDEIRRYYRQHGQDDVHRSSRPPIRVRGKHHDLRRLRDRVNKKYFEGELEVKISWGREPSMHTSIFHKILGRRAPRSQRGFHIRLGSYNDRDRLVRIHPVLDRADVPAMVVESIIYHEMLHAAFPPIQRRSRRSIHHAEFRRRERLFTHYEEAEAWIADNVARLARLRS